MISQGVLTRVENPRKASSVILLHPDVVSATVTAHQRMHTFLQTGRRAEYNVAAGDRVSDNGVVGSASQGIDVRKVRRAIYLNTL